MFTSLEEMARFAKLLQGGYVLNTITLTLTLTLTLRESEDQKVVQRYHNASREAIRMSVGAVSNNL